MVRPVAPTTTTPVDTNTSKTGSHKLLETLDRCTAVGGMITARVNDQLQKLAITLPPEQDDLMDYHYIPGSVSTSGSVTPNRQSSGNITAISAQMGHDAITACLQRALGRGLDFDQIAKEIEAAGGAVETEEIETGGLISRRRTVGKHRAVGVPR